MTTKLISANMGMKLVLEIDGQERTVEFSAVCPSEATPNPTFMVGELLDLINETFGTKLYVKADSFKGEDWNVPIAKPRRIKAPKRVSQDEFNRRIKELQP